MKAQEIWLMSFLAYGLLLDVSKGRLVGYHLIANRERLYQAHQQQQTTTEAHLGIFDRVNTTDVSEEFEPITNLKGLVINKPLPGQEGYIGTSVKDQKAKYSTSIWNQNQHKHRTTTEPRLGAFDRVNTTDVPEEFEPVTNSRGVVINRPVHGQEMFNDVFNPGYVVTNRGGMNQEHSSQKQPLDWMTAEPHLGIFDRINTTDVPEEFEPVTNYKGVVINKPVHGQEMYNDIMAPGRTIINRGNSSHNYWLQNQPQHRTTTEPRLGTFDRVNTTDVPEEFEPITNSEGVVINKPIPGQEMHNDTLRSGHESMDILLKQGATKLQAAERVGKQANWKIQENNSNGQVQGYSVSRKSKQTSLERQRSTENEVQRDGTEKDDMLEEEQEQKENINNNI